jgi:predicted transcriptional regulator
MTPESIARSRKATIKEIAAMELAELRDTLKVTQVDLAKRTKVSQAAISKLEKPNRNIHVDQLRSIVSAMGGNLIIIADFADILQSGVVLCYTSQNLGEFSECLHSSARPQRLWSFPAGNGSSGKVVGIKATIATRQLGRA